MATGPDSAYPRPSILDWVLLGISVLFVLGGLFLLPFDPNTGIVTVAFFGLCAAVHGATVIRKLRFSRMNPAHVEIVGGVPIKPLRANLIIIGAAVAVLGVVILVFGRHYGLLFWSIGWLLAAVGLVLLAGVATGLLPAGHLQFDPRGLTIAGRGHACLIPWDNISKMSAGEYNRNPALFIWLHRNDAVEVDPPEYKGKMLKRFATATGLIGAPVMLLTSQYGLALPLLAQAMERYITIPAARAELSRGLLSR
jgi:hypothetical protein